MNNDTPDAPNTEQGQPAQAGEQTQAEQPGTGDAAQIVEIPLPDSAGVLGDGALHPGKYNMRMVERAIRNDWPITEDIRRRLVNQMDQVISTTGPLETRNKVAAARVLIAADNVNIKRESLDLQAEHHANPAAIPHVHSGIVGIAPIRHELLTDAQYLEYVRSRAIEGHVDTGPVCQDGQSGPSGNVEADKPSGAD